VEDRAYDESRGALEDSDELNERYLYLIARKIEPDKYFDMGLLLGLEYSEIESIKTSNPHSSSQWVFLVLNKWRQRQEMDADKIQILAVALQEIGKVDLANKVRAAKGTSSKSIVAAIAATSRSMSRCDELLITPSNGIAPISFNIPHILKSQRRTKGWALLYVLCQEPQVQFNKISVSSKRLLKLHRTPHLNNHWKTFYCKKELNIKIALKVHL
ncbi:unnamed protein product, partial [Owenia fusiformis]